MGKFDRGVLNYTITTAEITVSFPEDDVCCRWCPYLKHYETIDRDRCIITNDILYSRQIIGHNCPLVIINNVKAEDLEK